MTLSAAGAVQTRLTFGPPHSARALPPFETKALPLLLGRAVPASMMDTCEPTDLVPLQRRVKHAVDKRFDRARYDGQSIADTFAATVRDEIDRDRLRSSLVVTVSEAVRPSTAAVWIRTEPER